MGRMFPQANSSHRFWAPLVEIHYLNNNTIIQVKKEKKKKMLNSTNLDLTVLFHSLVHSGADLSAMYLTRDTRRW